MTSLTECQDRRFYVYLHKRKSDNKIFYVGKGNGSRGRSTSGRNRYWWNVRNKHGIIIEIYKDKLTNQVACELETKLIAELRADGVDLCNIANGGEGGLAGIPLSKEHREKLRGRKLGRRQSPEHARKSAMAKLGKRQPRDAVERMVKNKRKSVINSNGEVFPSASEAARVIGKRLGIKGSQGNISMCCRGERREAYGMAWSYNTKSKPDQPTHITKQMRRIKCSNGMVFDSVQDASRWVAAWRGKANNQSISAAARGESLESYGFKWEYI